MNPRYLMALGTLMLGFSVVSSTYKPWEEIKNWYHDMEYDRKGADERHEEMEKNCTDVVEKHEGLCFDDCMFRTHYKLIVLEGKSAGDGRYYYLQDENQGVRKLERKILQVKGVKNLSVLNAETPLNTELHQWLSQSSCQIRMKGLALEAETKLKNNYLEAADSLCTRTLNEEEKGIMTRVVNCAKEKLAKN